MRLHLCPVYSVLLYISFCPLLSFSGFIILYVLLSPFQNTCPLGSAQALLSCSVYSNLTSPSVISFLFRTSCPAYHSCPAFPVSIFLNNLYTPLHCHYCLPGILLKGLLTFNPCPVPCCPSCLLSCLLSCLSQLIYSAKELYPNTQFNIIVLVFILEFCKLIITYVIDCFS
jgi:hypothetical protein